MTTELGDKRRGDVPRGWRLVTDYKEPPRLDALVWNTSREQWLRRNDNGLDEPYVEHLSYIVPIGEPVSPDRTVPSGFTVLTERGHWPDRRAWFWNVTGWSPRAKEYQDKPYQSDVNYCVPVKSVPQVARKWTPAIEELAAKPDVQEVLRGMVRADEYREGQIKSGIALMDCVLITRAASDGERGWGSVWRSDMTALIGSIGTVAELSDTHGVRLVGCDRWFPYFVLTRTAIFTGEPTRHFDERITQPPERPGPVSESQPTSAERTADLNSQFQVGDEMSQNNQDFEQYAKVLLDMIRSMPSQDAARLVTMSTKQPSLGWRMLQATASGTRKTVAWVFAPAIKSAQMAVFLATVATALYTGYHGYNYVKDTVRLPTLVWPDVEEPEEAETEVSFSDISVLDR